MNAEIDAVLYRLEQVFYSQRLALSLRSDAGLENLKHECEALRNDASQLVRIAAGINQAACEVILEAREKAESGKQKAEREAKP